LLGLRDDVYKYGVGTIKLYHGIALLLLVMFLVQLITGILLVSLISLQLDLAFTHLYYVLTSNWYIWILRDLHMLGANLSMILLYAHMIKATTADLLTFPRVSIWISGASLLLLALGVAFTGYILVSGQMSY
jgi:ubiquinol-cytochrome c reductase cytochrome b subunit